MQVIYYMASIIVLFNLQVEFLCQLDNFQVLGNCPEILKQRLLVLRLLINCVTYNDFFTPFRSI